MIRPNINPPQWLATKLNVPASGNQVCELRFVLDSVPDNVKIKACAYPNYAVYLNGEFVGSDEFSYVTEYNITPKLRTGENKLKVFIMPNQSEGWISLEFEGLPVDLSTRNSAWQWLQDDPLMQHAIPICIRGATDAPWDGAGQQFSEVPTKPYRPTGVVNMTSHGATVMFPKGGDITTYCQGDRVPFEHEIVFDFGKETLGYLEAEIEVGDDCSVTIAYSESFNCLDVSPWWHMHDTFKLHKGRNRIHDPSRKGFRYVRLTVDKGCRVTVLDIINHRPVRELRNKGYFKCSDDFLNRVNEVSCYTVELCSQKFLEDGVKRDRLCWTGDLRPMALVMYNQLGDTDIVRDSLYVFARHTNEHGVIQPAYPWRTGWVMTDYVMWWIISLWEYFQHTGDIETLRELAPIAFEQEKWLRSKCDERGLIITRTEGDAPITCWSSRSRDGYTAYHNCLWHYAKCCLLDARVALGLEAKDSVKQLHTRIKNSRFLNSIFVDSNNLWRDLDFNGNFRLEIPHDGCITAGLTRVSPVEFEYDGCDENGVTVRTSDAIKDHGWTNYGSPLWWPSGEGEPTETANRIMPLYNAYEIEERMIFWNWNNAIELLRRCYGHMLDLGSTTFWEALQLDGNPDPKGQEGFVSLCHGWSGYPASFLPEHLCGYHGFDPRRIHLSPRNWDKLEFMEASVPVRGDLLRLRSEWDLKTRTWRYSGRLPSVCDSGEISTMLFANDIDAIETVNCSHQLIGESLLETGESLLEIELKPGETFEVTIKCKESCQS